VQDIAGKGSIHAKEHQWDSCTTITTTIKEQASNSHGQKAQDREQATILCIASQIAVVPQGLQHCGQANLMHSKPQQSQPTRAQDIAGKLLICVQQAK
jgi:hypothetical protein